MKRGWPRVRSRLLVAESLDRIDTGGAARGEVAGGHSAEAEREDDEQNSGSVVTDGSIEERAEHAAGGPGHAKTDGHSSREQQERVGKDQPEDVFTLSAEREANAQLARALADGIGEQAVDAGDGDEQSDEAEDAEQAGGP